MLALYLFYVFCPCKLDPQLPEEIGKDIVSESRNSIFGRKCAGQFLPSLCLDFPKNEEKQSTKKKKQNQRCQELQKHDPFLLQKNPHSQTIEPILKH